MTATVFLVLLAGHLLGDWVAQTDWQATTKTRSWAALTAHVASYHLLMGLLLLIPILRDGWPAGKALAALAASAITHAVIDRRWPVRALMRAAGSPGPCCSAEPHWSAVPASTEARPAAARWRPAGCRPRGGARYLGSGHGTYAYSWISPTGRSRRMTHDRLSRQDGS
jgi:hypothetical protein